jgi:VanZ family protein
MIKIRTVLWAIWTLALIAILLLPLKDGFFTPGGFHYWDKVVHFGLFAVTGFISIYGASFFSKFSYRFIFGLVFGLALAIGTESGQSFVPSRSTSLFDLLADLIGLSLGLLTYALLYRQENIRQRLRL